MPTASRQFMQIDSTFPLRPFTLEMSTRFHSAFRPLTGVDLHAIYVEFSMDLLEAPTASIRWV